MAQTEEQCKPTGPQKCKTYPKAPEKDGYPRKHFNECLICFEIHVILFAEISFLGYLGQIAIAEQWKAAEAPKSQTY